MLSSVLQKNKIKLLALIYFYYLVFMLQEITKVKSEVLESIMVVMIIVYVEILVYF